MGENTRILRYVKESKFVRSIFLRVLAIFIIVSIAIVAVVFFSFSSEISKNIIAERQKQLAVIENSVSERMEEITSIAYNIGADPTFYLEPVDGDKYSGYEMSTTLSRYLVGNSFIEHLAYYRLSEPDTIYTAKGELSLSNFWSSYMGVDKTAAAEYTKGIQGSKRPTVVALNFGAEGSWFAYVFPLPQFSTKPQAFVLILIPAEEVEPLLKTQLVNSSGVVAVFDANGNEVYRTSTVDENIPIDLNAMGGTDQEQYVTVNGQKYVMQKQVSASNGWTYVSMIRLNDMISGLASRQIGFIIILLLLMFVAIFAMLISIIIQYKPINKLATEVTPNVLPGENSVVDEGKLLSSTFATLKDDSEQKQKFETAYHEAENANRAKSAFLSSMSHDIRTPMNAVIGMTAIAYKHADEPDYVRECLQKVQVASDYLMDIINNVLDMSRIESGRFSLSEEAVELPKLVYGLETILNPSVEAKGQKLVVEVDDLANKTVLGDSVRLTQVFINILSNSVKYTPEGGTISLHVCQTESSEPGYGDYVFKFSDTGIGMPKEFVAQVFDTFSRADDASVSKTEGTGLGMAIAKNLVELMGGTILCESELGRGTQFTVTLHMKLADGEIVMVREHGVEQTRSRAAQQPNGAAAPDFEGRRVLLVEDNSINREIARRIICETKAQVVEVVNGQEAVEAFRNHSAGYFDIILMDLQMPVMNGYEATAAIRSLPREDGKTVPIYAMTANTFDEDVRQVREAGMNGHLGKPYLPEDLYRIIGQTVNS